MKFLYVFLILILIGFSQEGIAQPFDTLLLDFKTIDNIYALEDSTFLLVGSLDSTCRVSRINSRAETIWTIQLSNTNDDYRLRESEFHLNENDSSIQVLMFQHQCDISLNYSKLLTTIDFDGNLIDQIDVPNRRTFLLSGELDAPRYAQIENDSVIITYANGDTLIFEDPFMEDVLWPKLVDMCPNGDISICYDGFNIIRIYRLVENQYRRVSGFSAGSYPAREFICIDSNLFLLLEYHQLQLVDTFGTNLGSFGPTKEYLRELHWKKPYVTFSSYDSLYLLDQFLNRVFTSPRSSGQYFNDVNIFNDNILKVGYDHIYPFLGGHIQSENRITHEGSEFYDLEFVSFELSSPDEIIMDTFYNIPVAIYNFPQAWVQVRNHSEFSINEVVISYVEEVGCRPILNWSRQLFNTDLDPGESGTYLLEDVQLARFYPFQFPFNECLTAFRADRHADDNPDDNNACKQNIATSVTSENGITELVHFPNPVKDELFIQTSLEEELDIQIYNVNGLLIESHKIIDKNNAIDVKNLLPGLYFLQVNLSNGNIRVEKIIKI